jgi:hypothetical protein
LVLHQKTISSSGLVRKDHPHQFHYLFRVTTFPWNTTTYHYFRPGTIS